MTTYSPADIEAKWQETWWRSETFKATASADRPKYYVLEMFPTRLVEFTWVTSETIRWAMS